MDSLNFQSEKQHHKKRPAFRRTVFTFRVFRLRSGCVLFALEVGTLCFCCFGKGAVKGILE